MLTYFLHSYSTLVPYLDDAEVLLFRIKERLVKPDHLLRPYATARHGEEVERRDGRCGRMGKGKRAGRRGKKTGGHAPKERARVRAWPKIVPAHVHAKLAEQHAAQGGQPGQAIKSAVMVLNNPFFLTCG